MIQAAESMGIQKAVEAEQLAAEIAAIEAQLGRQKRQNSERRPHHHNDEESTVNSQRSKTSTCSSGRESNKRSTEVPRKRSHRVITDMQQLQHRQTPPTTPVTPTTLTPATSTHTTSSSGDNANANAATTTTTTTTTTAEAQRLHLEEEIRQMEAAIKEKKQKRKRTVRRLRKKKPKPQTTAQTQAGEQDQNHSRTSGNTIREAAIAATDEDRKLRQKLEAEIAAMEASVIASQQQQQQQQQTAATTAKANRSSIGTHRAQPTTGLTLMDSIAQAGKAREKRLRGTDVSTTSQGTAAAPQLSLADSIARAALAHDKRSDATGTGGALPASQPQKIGSFLDGIANAVAAREGRLGAGEQNISAFPPPHAHASAPSLFDEIANAAAAREGRVEAGEQIMQDVEPEVKPHRRITPQLSFDMAVLVSKAARDREQRLADGGEKKMTEVKEKEEYKKDFNGICIEAAELGRLTRLSEHVVEATAVEKTPEEEWRSSGLMAIQWQSNHMSVIHDAARAGAECKLPEKITSNCEEEETYGDWEHNEKPRSSRMQRLLELTTRAGDGQHKTDHFVMGCKEESHLAQGDNLLVRPMVCYSNVSDVQLPRKFPPKFDPEKAKQRMANAMKYSSHENRPMADIGNEVATLAWERRSRLDRPNSLPKIKERCNCPYCEHASPFQTHAYKIKEKRRKEEGYVSPDEDGPEYAQRHRDHECMQRMRQNANDRHSQTIVVEQYVNFSKARAKFGNTKAEQRQTVLEKEHSSMKAAAKAEVQWPVAEELPLVTTKAKQKQTVLEKEHSGTEATATAARAEVQQPVAEKLPSVTTKAKQQQQQQTFLEKKHSGTEAAARAEVHQQTDLEKENSGTEAAAKAEIKWPVAEEQPSVTTKAEDHQTVKKDAKAEFGTTKTDKEEQRQPLVEEQYVEGIFVATKTNEEQQSKKFILSNVPSQLSDGTRSTAGSSYDIEDLSMYSESYMSVESGDITTVSQCQGTGPIKMKRKVRKLRRKRPHPQPPDGTHQVESSMSSSHLHPQSPEPIQEEHSDANAVQAAPCKPTTTTVTPIIPEDEPIVVVQENSPEHHQQQSLPHVADEDDGRTGSSNVTELTEGAHSLQQQQGQPVKQKRLVRKTRRKTPRKTAEVSPPVVAETAVQPLPPNTQEVSQMSVEEPKPAANKPPAPEVPEPVKRQQHGTSLPLADAVDGLSNDSSPNNKDRRKGGSIFKRVVRSFKGQKSFKGEKK